MFFDNENWIFLLFPMCEIDQKTTLIIEPFCSGSHKQLIDLFRKDFGDSKLFVTSVLNLAELISLRPDLGAACTKSLYFHENQLVYPVNHSKGTENDFQFGYAQILSREHDKNPELFFNVLFQLKSNGFKFSLVVLGENYVEKPQIFEKARDMLKDEIKHWGYVDDKATYYNLLRSCHVVVSTANHEFFGVSMLEAAYLDSFTLCPNRLCYPEIYPKECLYSTDAQLYKSLKNFCKHPALAAEKRLKLAGKFAFDLYSWDALKDRFAQFL